MPVRSRLIFELLNFAARNGLSESHEPSDAQADMPASEKKLAARRTGMQGETFAYWYLRRNGYVMVARNYTAPPIKGEIDLVGWDGPVLAFVEVKTRTPAETPLRRPEDAVNLKERQNPARIARRFLQQRRIGDAPWRFDVLAIDSPRGCRPDVRLHKEAFAGSGEVV